MGWTGQNSRVLYNSGSLQDFARFRLKGYMVLIFPSVFPTHTRHPQMALKKFEERAWPTSRKGFRASGSVGEGWYTSVMQLKQTTSSSQINEFFLTIMEFWMLSKGTLNFSRKENQLHVNWNGMIPATFGAMLDTVQLSKGFQSEIPRWLSSVKEVWFRYYLKLIMNLFISTTCWP